MRLVLLALVVPLVLAGCARGPDASTGDEGSCEARFSGPLAPFASLVPTLQDEPDVAMQRLAEIVNDTPRDAPVVHGATIVWTAERGTLRWERDGNASARVSYEAHQDPIVGAAGARALLETAIASFQPPYEIAYEEEGNATRAVQLIGGRPVEGAGAEVAGRMLRVGPLLQLDPNVALADDDRVLIPRALEVARCVDADATSEAARVTVGPHLLRDEALVVRLSVPSGPEGCAGALLLDLHAVDGTLAPPILCDAEPAQA